MELLSVISIFIFLFFMTLTIFRNTSEILFRMSFNYDLSGILLVLKLKLLDFNQTLTEVNAFLLI